MRDVDDPARGVSRTPSPLGRWPPGSLVVVVALPFAAHQTDHLTGGGFDVPGSQSKAVSDALQSDFGAQRRRDRRGAQGRRRGAAAAERAAAVAPGARGGRRGRRAHACRRPRRAAREAQLQRTGDRRWSRCAARPAGDELIDSATTLREDLDPGTAEGGVTTYLAGQPTIWAGMQELSKEDLAKAEAGGFPIVALILLVVFGSLAAAALPLALGFVSVIVTGALIYFISLQMATSVFVTNMASMIGIGVAVDYSLFILARYREERRAGREPRRGARPGARDLGPGRHLLRPRRDRLAGRPLDGRQPGAALDGARRDDRRRRLDPHRDDPAAGADRDARRPRHARRRRRPGRLRFVKHTVLRRPQAGTPAAPATERRRLLGPLDARGSWPAPGPR